MAVTVLGLGAMGQALAAALLEGGHPTTVWNRTADKASALAARGATVAATAAEAIGRSPVVVVCVLNYAAVREVVEPVADTLAGRTLVNLTNGTPRQARETAEWAASHRVHYVDGGIMAVPSMVGGPHAHILYSGSRDAFVTHEQTLGALGAATYLGADAGHASLHDLALLSAMYGLFGGFFHAVALVGSERVKASEFTPQVVAWLDAMIAALPAMAAAFDSGDHSATESNLRMQAVGFVNLLDASKDLGVSTSLVEPMYELLNRGVAAGRGDGGISGVIDLLRTV